MRRLEKLISEVRTETENEDEPTSTVTLGIDKKVIIQFLNDAQDRLQSLISAKYPNAFDVETTFNTVANQEAYTISDRVYLNNRLHTVELSVTGSDRDYVELPHKKLKERLTETSSEPSFYLQRAGSILLNPIPTSATPEIRVVYERELDDLAIRSGKISSVTGSGTSVSPITAITLASSAPTPDSELDDIDAGDYICVCNLNGTVLARNLPVTAYNSGTRVITVTNFVLATGETLPAANHYVTLGKYTTNVSNLPEMCERYLIAFACWKVFLAESSMDLGDKERELGAMERDILDSYADLNRDVEYIPILDPENL